MKITCKCNTTRNIKDLVIIQGDIKSMSKKDRKKLTNSLKKYGLMVPWIVWGNKVMDGTQRTDILINNLNYLGDVPVVEIEANSEDDARAKLLTITSQSGRFNLEELQIFSNGLDLDTVSLVDGPTIDLDFKVGLEPAAPPLIEDIEIVDSDEYEQAEVEEIKTNVGDVMTFPDGTILTAGDDRYFFEECIRMWNSRNKKLQVSLTKVSN